MDKRIFEVSGDKHSVAVARVLFITLLLLADEPTGNLDSKAAIDVMELFTKLNKEEDATILMVTHDPFAASYCNRVIFIKDGELYNELHRGLYREKFYQEILDVLALLGGRRG